jgi:two-component system, OmpR family, response regulator ResD
MSTVVVIEDDARVRELLVRYLEREGIRAFAAADGLSGLAAVEARAPDLVLLDVQLPDLDGWSILRRLQEAKAGQLAVIMLTARSDEPDRVLGLELGADDYIVKPFSPREVVARIKAVLRRAGRPSLAPAALEFPGLRIDEAGRRVWREEEAVALTPKEFDLLLLLARNAGRVLTRASLYDQVWGDEGQGDDHTLDVHVNRLRRKLAAGGERNYLATVKGIGFRFEVDDGGG